MTATELVEKTILTTRQYRGESELLVSLVGVAFQNDAANQTGALLTPNDQNVSLPVSSHHGDDYQLTIYHCFAGLFASRIYHCLDKPWEIFRLHLNVHQTGAEPSADYGEILSEKEQGNSRITLSIEHFGPRIFPHELLVDAFEGEYLDQLTVACPVKLTPRPEFYRIGLECHPHPGLLMREDAAIAEYLALPKEPKRSYLV